VLQLCFGLADVAVLPYTTPPNRLRVRALNPSSTGVFGCEPGTFLPLPRGLDRLVLGFWPDRQLARRLFGSGARLADRARATGRPIKADAHHGIARDIPSWGPLDARLPLRTAGLFGLLVQYKGG
jgi:hypothetical protein